MPQGERTIAASARSTRARQTSAAKVAEKSKPATPAQSKTRAKAAPGKKTSADKASAKKTSPAKKSSAEKTSPKKSSPAKKTQTTKAPPGKARAKPAAAKKPVKAAKTKKRAARPALPVRAGEDSWTTSDVAEVRADLEADRGRLLDEVTAAERELKTLLRDGGDGAGFDQADVGSNVLERDAEMSLANNSREMLVQVERALVRLDDGSYGVCESCGEPIGKLRLMAFPRATLCLSCKQRQERR